jgi:hypothetical protein
MAANPRRDGQNRRLVAGLIARKSKSKIAAAAPERKSGLVWPLMPAPLMCLLAACGSASAMSDDAANSQAKTANAATVVASTTVTDPTAFKLGTVLATIQYWDGSRPFMNLLYGGSWQMANDTSGATDLPAQYLDANGWVKSLPAGYRVFRGLSIPAAGGNFTCHYQGNGLLQVGGPTVSNVSMVAGQTTFTITAGYPNQQLTYIQYNVDPANYIRGIDCREVSASTTATFSPEFMDTLNGFKVLRFVKWMPSVESNSDVQSAFPTPTITWATRNKPGDGDYIKNDGVPVEVMVDLANQAGANPWFNIPWNADDDYITRFATYVRDNLAPDKQVYVETSNEVWNPGYPVYHQAAAEGLQEGLPGDIGGEFQRTAERYGEKTNHVMQIWSNVFAGQMTRLVRVYAFQNVQPYYGEMGLKYAMPNVDAYATAPYWAFMQSDYTGQTLDQIMNTVLPAKMAETLSYAAQDKALAQKYSLRYVTYEAGQHVVLPNNLALLKQIEQDPRMYDLYKSYVTQWQSQFGDTMNLFALTGGISGYGAWGMTEYNGQPIDQAPKLKAVRDFLGIGTTSTSTGTTTTTQVCPDGTVVPLTSTCPVSTSTGGSTGSTTPGKKKAVGKGGSKSGTAIV